MGRAEPSRRRVSRFRRHARLPGQHRLQPERRGVMCHRLTEVEALGMSHLNGARERPVGERPSGRRGDRQLSVVRTLLRDVVRSRRRAGCPRVAKIRPWLRRLQHRQAVLMPPVCVPRVSVPDIGVQAVRRTTAAGRQARRRAGELRGRSGSTRAGRRIGQGARIRWRVRGARPARAPAGRWGRRHRVRIGSRLAGTQGRGERTRSRAGMILDRSARRGAMPRRGQIVRGRCGRGARQGGDRIARHGSPEGPGPRVAAPHTAAARATRSAAAPSEPGPPEPGPPEPGPPEPGPPEARRSGPARPANPGTDRREAGRGEAAKPGPATTRPRRGCGACPASPAPTPRLPRPGRTAMAREAARRAAAAGAGTRSRPAPRGSPAGQGETR